MPSVTWFSGASGSGKTYEARRLQAHRELSDGSRSVILDGDEMRACWPGLTYTREDREEQNRRVARLARALRDQGFDVIVATICPYRELRAECDRIVGGAEWVFLSGGEPNSVEHPYEAPAPFYELSHVDVSYWGEKPGQATFDRRSHA